MAWVSSRSALVWRDEVAVETPLLEAVSPAVAVMPPETQSAPVMPIEGPRVPVTIEAPAIARVEPILPPLPEPFTQDVSTARCNTAFNLPADPAGSTALVGTGGNDYLVGTTGDDSIDGGAGDDVIFGNGGTDQIRGGDGNDWLYTSVGKGDFWTGAGADTVVLTPLPGNQYFDSWWSVSMASESVVHDFTAEDELCLDWAKVPADFVANGYGSIPFYPTQRVTEQGLELTWWFGNARVVLEGVTKPLSYDADTCSFYLVDNPVEGDESDNTLNGTSHADDLRGNAGYDVLNGYAGHDQLDGGDCGDTINGGAGKDTIVGGRGYDIVDGGTGDDVIYGDTAVTIWAMPEEDYSGDYLLGGDGNDVIYGDFGKFVGYYRYYLREDSQGGDDYIDGGAGDDKIMGQAGNDTLFGGAGNDLIYGGYGDDYISGGDGDDGIYTGIGTDHVWGDGGNDIFRVGFGAPPTDSITYIHDFSAGDSLNRGDEYYYYSTEPYGDKFTQTIAADGLHLVYTAPVEQGGYTRELVLLNVFHTLTYDAQSDLYVW